MPRKTIETLESITQKRLCMWLDTSKVVLLDWERDGMPRLADGHYDPAAVLPWLKARWLEAHRESSATDKNSPALERFREARAKQVEMQLARQKGELVSIAEVRQEWSRALTGLKNALLGLPARIAPRLSGQGAPIIAAELDGAIRGIIGNVREGYLQAAAALAVPEKKAVKTKAKRRVKR